MQWRRGSGEVLGGAAAASLLLFYKAASALHVDSPVEILRALLREFLRSQNLPNTQIYAKIDNFEGLDHFDEILQEADGIILSRGHLGIDLPPEKVVFVHQKSAIKKCNMAGKPAIVTRVVDSMVDNLRPTRAEATDVANAVLDGTDGILLGAETHRGLYPVETIRTVGQICAEAESVYNHYHQFKEIVQYVGEPMSYEESVASSAVRSAIKVKAAVIVVFTTTGSAPRLVAKYRPPMPVLALVFSQGNTDLSESNSFGTTQARQTQAVRGVYPILAISSPGDTSSSKEESALKLALNYGRSVGMLKPYDRAVIFQKIGDSVVAKIIEFEDS
ncbi:pyruvate kinase 1, cytosolic [Canna indica]|uniref:Pyruvate kinase n=1 Tax=Canna indica TaxID=4628 RepID=A0AAQ3KTD1_9LILI|nr:pyruvate kinase 1, cytosolic [Canna indica]